IVLMALVIVAAAVVPSLRGAGRQGDLDDVAARIAASARFARETAAVRGATADLAVDTSSGSILLTLEQDASGTGPQAMPAPGTRSTGAAGTTVLPSQYAQ